MPAAIPCQHGFPSLRKCDECRRSSKQGQRDPEKRREARRRNYAANIEKQREYKRRWQAATPEKQREYKRRYHAAHPEMRNHARSRNPEKSREYNRRYNETHREQHREAQRRWLLAHPEYQNQNREKTRQWRKNNPEKARAKSERDARTRRARKAGVPSDPTVTLEAVWGRDKGQCYICHEAVLEPGLLDWQDPWAPSTEHVIPITGKGADTWDNVRLAHRSCNSVKGARRTADEARAIILARPVA